MKPKKKLRRFNIKIWCMFFCLCFAGQAYSRGDDPFSDLDTDLSDEIQWLRAETYVVTASRVSEDIRKSAASISVVTAREIKQMGARHLMDVLQRVCGVSPFYVANGQYYNLDTRGVMKQYSQDVLLLLDGRPLNSSYFGSATWTLDTMQVENVKRIEVIRGPGSTLYGANAFSAVINIISRDGSDIEGWRALAGFGSYKTQQYNLLYGRTFDNGLDISFNADFWDTDGFRAYIEEDFQTSLDQFFGTSASLAPDRADANRTHYDVSLHIKQKDLEFNGRYIDKQKDLGPVFGKSINHDSAGYSIDYSLELEYSRRMTDTISLSGIAYRNHSYLENFITAYPPGFTAPTPSGLAVMPRGLQAIAESRNNRTGLELVTTLTPGNANTVLIGATYEKMEQYGVRYAANFMYTPVGNVIDPLPEMTDLTDIQNYNQNVDRSFTAAFIENLWDIRDDLRLTTGLRYDYYSDFGGSFNPRAGLVWEFITGYDLKILYGRAFRAPSFYELYNENNPSLVGNPDLDPETVETCEIGVRSEITDDFGLTVTGFHNTIENNIMPINYETQTVLANVGRLRSRGVEAEFQYDFGKGSTLQGNYTFQDTKDPDTDETEFDIPRHKGNLIWNQRFSKYMNCNLHVMFHEGWERETDDAREDNPGFEVVNLTLLGRNLYKGLEISFSIFNVFDEPYSYPAPKNSLPGDYPMPGRNFFVELRYTGFFE